LIGFSRQPLADDESDEAEDDEVEEEEEVEDEEADLVDNVDVTEASPPPDVRPSSKDEVSVVGEVLPDFNLSSEVAGLTRRLHLLLFSGPSKASFPSDCRWWVLW